MSLVGFDSHQHMPFLEIRIRTEYLYNLKLNLCPLVSRRVQISKLLFRAVFRKEQLAKGDASCSRIKLGISILTEHYVQFSEPDTVDV